MNPLVPSSYMTIQVNISLVANFQMNQDYESKPLSVTLGLLGSSLQMEQELARFLGLGSRMSCSFRHIQDVHIVSDSLRRPSRKTLLERLYITQLQKLLLIASQVVRKDSVGLSKTRELSKRK